MNSTSKMMITGAAFLAMCLPANAGGLAPPVSERPTARPETPASPDWVGLYARAAAGAQAIERESVTVTEVGKPVTCDFPETKPDGYKVAMRCYHEPQEPDVLIDIEEFEESAVLVGFGARWQAGAFVYGGELNAAYNFDADEVTLAAEATAGISVGAALPYLSAGWAEGENGDGAIYGLGLDYMVADDIFVGAKVRASEDLGLRDAFVGFGVKQ